MCGWIVTITGRMEKEENICCFLFLYLRGFSDMVQLPHSCLCGWCASVLVSGGCRVMHTLL